MKKSKEVIKKNANTHTFFRLSYHAKGKKKKKGVKNIIKIFYFRCHTGRHFPAEEKV